MIDVCIAPPTGAARPRRAGCRPRLWAMLGAIVPATVPVAGSAADPAAQALFEEHCAVCHGADRGGYIGPALNSDSLAQFTEGQVAAKIITGGVGTLMPHHPTTWFGRLSTDEVRRIARFVRHTPKAEVTWGIDDIRGSLRVLADESALPDQPRYPIDRMDDLMVVAARGRYSAGQEAKLVFIDGRRHRTVAELPLGHAPHVVDFHPRDERWAYATSDDGTLYRIDLYDARATRSIRIGLNGASLAVSRDGRLVAAGSYVPDAAVILDAGTLEPVKHLKLSGTDPDGRWVDADSGVILASPYDDCFILALEQAGQVWVVDLDTPDLPVTRIENVGRHLHDGFLSPDGRHLAVSSYDDNVIAVIDLETAQVVRRMPAGAQPHLGSGAVVEVDGRMLGIGTNIGYDASGQHRVTVFDLTSFEIVRQIPVLGPSESPAAHPKAPYIVVDIVGTGPEASKIQFIDKRTLEVVRTITVGGHSHFPEYTARGDFLYVSAGYGGDRLVVYDARSLERVRTISMEVPAGVFSRLRSRLVAPGLAQSGG